MSRAAPSPVGTAEASGRRRLLAPLAQSFLRRNRTGLILLGPALLLALGTAAMQYQSVYLPTTMSAPHTAEADGWSRLDVQIAPSGVPVHRVVAARIAAKEDLGPVQDVSQPGTHIVRLEVAFEAPSASPLVSCSWRILGTDGDRYTPLAVGEEGGGEGERAAFDQGSCVPAATPGPSYGFGDDAPVEDPSAAGPRPPTWTRVALVSVPDGVDVDSVQIGWEPPDYLELPAPGA